MPKRIEKENDRHREAYRCYLELGPDRTLSEVARRLEVTETSVQRWARSFRWDKRVAEHDVQVARRTLDLAEEQGVEVDAQAKARNLKLVQMAMLQLAKALAGGNVRMQLSDLDRLVKLEQLLTDVGDGGGTGSGGQRGGGDNDLERDLEGKTDEELWAILVEEVDAIRELAEWDDHVQSLVREGRIRPLPPIRPPASIVAKQRR